MGERRLWVAIVPGADGCVMEGLEMKRLFAAIAGLISSTSLAGALTLVAVVEDVQGNVTGAELMDYVVPGQVIWVPATLRPLFAAFRHLPRALWRRLPV